MEENTMQAEFDLSVIETKNSKLTLKVSDGKGLEKTLHSSYDPEGEAKSIVDAFRFDGKGILVVLGLGLGYHVAELAEKYPDAEILVIEAMREICELAVEHGPSLEGKAEIIAGVSPENALKEITRHQMNNGIKPLSLFSLSSEISAFPDYYNPILAALKKSVSLKLWDRLKYPKFTEDSHRVLLIDSGYFLVKEAEKALASLNHKIGRISIPPLVPAFIEAILKFKPDFILTMNHLGFDEDGVLTEFFKSIEMPVASWYVDSPRLIVEAFDKNVSPWMSLFLWDKSYMEDMRAMGFDSVMHLPLGTDETVFKPMKKIPPHPPLQKGGSLEVPLWKRGIKGDFQSREIDKYSCDVGFVGNSMVEPVDEWMEKVDACLHPIIERAAGCIAHSENRREDFMKVVIGAERDIITRLTKKEKMDFEAAVIWKATLLYRLSLIKELEGFDSVIHGDRGWRSLLTGTGIRLKPPLNYYRELPFFYNACKINFNATSLQMKEAVNQRVFDVPACGAFLLTDRQDALNELFDIGEEIVTYKHRDEIPELVKFYLKYPAERQRVASNGREKVLKEHTYKHRLQTMIEFMKQRYK